MGLNLSNGTPTVCINDLISDYNSGNDKDLANLEGEILTARIFNALERLLKDIEQTSSFDSFNRTYYSRWLHEDQVVQVLDSSGTKQSGMVTGIDEYGYLRVTLGEGKEDLSVHPDGNSFDMLRGLILPKFN